MKWSNLDQLAGVASVVPIVLLRNRGVHARSITILKEVEKNVSRNSESVGTPRTKKIAIQVYSFETKLQRDFRESKLSEVPINDGGCIKMPHVLSC
jgi:hypothetical protein